MKGYKTALVIYLIFVLVTVSGCEAFRKKFVRKPKKDMIEKEDIVFIPEEYSEPLISANELYEQHFLFWKSWHDELLTALTSSSSLKRVKNCIKEAIENLSKLKPLLFEEKQKELDVYLVKLRNLEQDIKDDIYGTKKVMHKRRAERLKRDILRIFSYSKIKNHLR